MRTYIDRPLHQGIACWPGDTPFEHQENAWETVRVGAITMSLHTGTHLDAPRHLISHHPSVDTIPDDVLCGPVNVIDARGLPILTDELFKSVTYSRVIIRTDAWLDSNHFPVTFPLLTTRAAQLLTQKGIVLLGLDLPSVDAVVSKDLPIHHILMNAGITICEGLDFHTSDIPACSADLMVVPFTILGADAAPARVWLENISR